MNIWTILALRKIKSHFQLGRLFYVSLRGSMTDPPPSTMAPSEAAAPPTTTQPTHTTPSTATGHPVSKSLVKLDCDLMIRAFFPTPTAPNKINPITAMRQLLRAMIKDETSLILCNHTNDKQIKLASESIPSGETEFKNFFKVSTTRIDQQKKTHVCIGCHVFSNRTLSAIKFQSPGHHLLDWLKKERVFVESDSLGIDRPITIGHFIKIAPDITHLTNFREHLASQLMLIDIDAATAVDLAPYLKDAQLEAMSNGDDYIPILPPFELYRTKITHGRDPNQVSTEVIGVKGKPRDAKLLSEFFTRLAATTSNDHRDGIFLPKGAVHQVGPQTYEQILQENNFFLTQTATIPVNLEYNAWFAVIEPQTTTDIEPISLHEHLLRQPWFQRIESAGRNKCLLVMTRPNLPVARTWVDENLEKLIRRSLPPDIDPPASQFPRRLDKPVYTTTSMTYADILKKQFSLAPNAPSNNTNNNRPPRKRQAKVIDYDSDTSEDASTPTAQQSSPKICNSSNSNQCTSSNISTSIPLNSTPTTVDYVAELASLKTDLNSLRSLITTAVEQLKNDIASLLVTPASSKMETEADEAEPPTSTTPALSDLFANLKHDIATKMDISDLIVKLKSDIALIKSHPLFCHLKPSNQCPVT